MFQKRILLSFFRPTEILFEKALVPVPVRQTLLYKGYKIGETAEEMLLKVSSPIVVSWDTLVLTRLETRDLGFFDGATFPELFEMARTFGLSVCPPEVGPALRILYDNQPKGESLHIAMDPLTDWKGRPQIFYLGHYRDGMWLDGDLANPERVWAPATEWVFSGSLVSH